MEVVSSLLNTAMEWGVLGVLLPDPYGACTLLPTLMDELDELKHLKSTDSLDFPGSTMSCTPPERCIWMKKIYKDRPIGQIVWPATHKSATNKIGINFLTRPFGQHQTLSIYYQLRNGVRVLDIRVQQDGRVCNGNFLSYSMADVIKDVNKFMSETQYEIIILEIRTERGYTDPPNFESYLVHELGDLLINQDDHVFSKTISQVLPRRVICIWKPKNSPKPSAGGPIWSASYLRDDEFETELPLTKFRANLINLSQQISASERNYFYKVEHILMPQANSAIEWMLVWPRHARAVSKRINEFARLFLANCNSQDILDRLQIYSTDFIDDDFIVACIALNHSMDIKEHKEHLEMMMQKPMQDLEELKKKFEDEKVRTHATQIYELREQQNKNALDKEHLEMMMQKHRQDFEEQVKNLEVQLETTKLKSIENMRQAVSEEKNRATQIQGDLEELRKKFEDEKVRTEAIKNSILVEKETLIGELADARKQLENMQRGSQDPELPPLYTPEVTVAPMPCEFELIDGDDRFSKFQLINGDGRFNVNGLGNFVEKVNFGECGVDYAILSIIGPPKSGKTTLLNQLFNTMHSYSDDRSQTTKGIWMGSCASSEEHILIMDVEGPYEKEREQTIEKQRVIFSLALSDIVLINIWYYDLGRGNSASTRVLRTLFTEILTSSKSKSRRVTLMFVIRDVSPWDKFETLEHRLKIVMNLAWDSILKPESHQDTPISEFCNVEVVALSYYQLMKYFTKEVDMLRQRLDDLLTSGTLTGDRGDVVPASAFAVSAEDLWRTIKGNKDLDTTAHKIITFSTMANGGELSNFAISPSCVLKIHEGDITQWFVDGSSDAIVNSANKRMLGGGGLDGAIHRAAGPELQEACYKVPEIQNGVRCPTGQAKITPGFKLPCSHVIHTVGPIYDYDENPQSSLKSAYRNSFRVAKENNIQYIAFPAISCGVLRYPYEEAATIALSSAKEFSKDFKEVHFVLLIDDIYTIWMKRANELRLTTSTCASQ